MSTLVQLFAVFSLLSLLAVGGGLAVLPEMKSLTEVRHHWITPDQFMDFYSLGQLAPGPNMNMVLLIGWQVAGPVGALAVLARLLPAIQPARVVGGAGMASPGGLALARLGPPRPRAAHGGAHGRGRGQPVSRRAGRFPGDRSRRALGRGARRDARESGARHPGQRHGRVVHLPLTALGSGDQPRPAAEPDPVSRSAARSCRMWGHLCPLP